MLVGALLAKRCAGAHGWQSPVLVARFYPPRKAPRSTYFDVVAANCDRGVVRKEVASNIEDRSSVGRKLLGE